MFFLSSILQWCGSEGSPAPADVHTDERRRTLAFHGDVDPTTSDISVQIIMFSVLCKCSYDAIKRQIRTVVSIALCVCGATFLQLPTHNFSSYPWLVFFCCLSGRKSCVFSFYAASFNLSLNVYRDYEELVLRQVLLFVLLFVWFLSGSALPFVCRILLFILLFVWSWFCSLFGLGHLLLLI